MISISSHNLYHIYIYKDCFTCQFIIFVNNEVWNLFLRGIKILVFFLKFAISYLIQKQVNCNNFDIWVKLDGINFLTKIFDFRKNK
jgi:hypothetical protein